MNIIRLILAIAFLVLVLCLPSRGQVFEFFNLRAEKGVVDSCINCNFMGLTNEQWKIKDAPFWHKIDSAAIAQNGGWYLGDLPSSMGNGPASMSGTCLWVWVTHPSIDTTIIEKHYYVKNGNHKEAIEGCRIYSVPLTPLTEIKKP